MADRYSYVPSIGIFYLAGEGFVFLWKKQFKWIPIALLAVFTIFFSATTYNRTKVWKDPMTFWNDMINKYQTIPEAYYSRGLAFKSEKKDQEALQDYTKAIELKSDYIQAYNNRGIIFLDSNKNEEALKDFKKTIEIDPDFVLGYNNLGLALYNEKQYEEAKGYFSKAIELKGDYANAYYNRGLASYYLGDKDAACGDLKEAINFGYQPPAEVVQAICN
jgi:tetratricopeptide (TPR) repeat protein